MIISASQLKTFNRCQRLWWFEKVKQLPGRGSSYGATFGSVIHKVLERWLLADHTGRSPDGNPVDLYPQNWQYTDDGLRIEEEHEEVIKAIVQEAADKGILQRRPGMQIEKHFLLDLIDDVQIQGYVDVYLPGEIQDHKSTGNMRYALSKAKLASDLQMLIYAYVGSLEFPDFEEWVLQHNVFERSGKMRTTTVQVPTADVIEHWEGVKETAFQMKILHDDETPEEDWKQLNDGMPDACNAYGGCRFIPICTDRETPEHYRARYERLNMASPKSKGLPTVKKTDPAPKRKPTLTILKGIALQQGAVGGRTTTLGTLLKDLVEATESTMQAYYKKNAFERRDLLKVVALDWAGGLDNDVVVLTSAHPTPDENSLLSAISPAASLILVGSA